MSNYRVKIKINDYFPKIDAIPYDDFICLISCNNYYSRIKLTEHGNQLFKFDLKILRNTDLLFNIKLINYLDNNKLVGMYNLIIPYNRVNQILQREISLYKQQIKLIMNSNVKIKLFGIKMNITNIYLDLIFQISAIKENAPIYNNQINKAKIYEMLGNNSYAKNYSKNKKKTKSNNTSITDGKRSNNININLSKSPIINYNNFMYDFKENDINKEKKFANSNNKNFNNNYNQKCSDINFNVMNYNYLNYLKIDNNNNEDDYVSNVKFNINSRSPILISKNFIDLNNQGNNNNINKNFKQENNSTNYNLYNKNKLNDSSNKKPKEKELNYTNFQNYQNISTKKKSQKKETQLNKNQIIKNNINDLNYNDSNKYNNNSGAKYFTEAKNSMNLDNINIPHEKTDSNQPNYKTKYQNFIKDNNNHQINYINNNINKNQNILYDKKNHLNKFVYNNKTGIKPKNSFNNNKENKEKEVVKTQVFRNKITISEFNETQTHESKTKTPRNFNEANLYQSSSNTNNIPLPINMSNQKKQEEENIIVTNISDKNNNLDKVDNKIDNKLENIFIYDIKNKTEKKYENKNKEKKEEIVKEKEIEENNENKKINNNNENIEIKEVKDVESKEKIEEKKVEEDLILNPEEFKNKTIKSLEETQNIKSQIITQMNKNKEYVEKLLLVKEKFFTELKQRNRLIEKTNHENLKNIIHVNIRGRLNSDLYLTTKKVKTKEFNILYKIFYEHKNSPQYKALLAKKKLKEKMEQQKQVHSLLNLIRELIKKYENLSQIYNEDEKKKILFKSLLLRYGIREKEESKENNLMDKFNEIKNKLEEEKKINLMKEKKKEIQEELYKNIIREEDDEERSSVSDHNYLKRKSSIRNRLSWCSDDSMAKEKENLESKSNNDDGNNSLLSSGLKKIRESKDEDLFKNDEKENFNEIKKDKEQKEEIINIKECEKINDNNNDDAKEEKQE